MQHSNGEQQAASAQPQQVDCMSLAPAAAKLLFKCLRAFRAFLAVQQERARLEAENSCLKRELLELVATLDNAERLHKLPDAGREVCDLHAWAGACI